MWASLCWCCRGVCTSPGVGIRDVTGVEAMRRGDIGIEADLQRIHGLACDSGHARRRCCPCRWHDRPPRPIAICTFQWNSATVAPFMPAVYCLSPSQSLGAPPPRPPHATPQRLAVSRPRFAHTPKTPWPSCNYDGRTSYPPPRVCASSTPCRGSSPSPWSSHTPHGRGCGPRPRSADLHN